MRPVTVRESLVQRASLLRIVGWFISVAIFLVMFSHVMEPTRFRWVWVPGGLAVTACIYVLLQALLRCRRCKVSFDEPCEPSGGSSTPIS